MLGKAELFGTSDGPVGWCEAAAAGCRGSRMEQKVRSLVMMTRMANIKNT